MTKRKPAITRNLFGYRDNNMTEIEVSGSRYLTDANFSPKYILGQAFGADRNCESYNQRMAESVIAAREFFKRDLPAIVQTEIGVLLQKYGIKNIQMVGETYAEGEKSMVVSKVSTKEVLSMALEKIKESGLEQNAALFVAHPYHIQRVMDRAGELDIEGRPFLKKEVEWPREDSQPWVRSPWLFVPRELVGRVLKK